jgi:hypothetical protein
MRLPLEIRIKVYKILLSRMYPGRHIHLHENAVGYGARFRINDSPYVPGWLEMDYDVRVTGNPEDRNVDQQASTFDNPGRVNLLDIYKAIQNDPGDQIRVPSSWIATRDCQQPPHIGPETISEEMSADKTDSDIETDEDTVSLPYDVNPFRIVDVAVKRFMDPDSACDPERYDINYLVDYYVYDYRMPDDYYECL